MKPPDYARYPLQVIGIAILIVSGLSIIGYGFDIPALYTQPGGTGMALMTAICLFLISLGFLMIARHEGKD